MSVPQLPVESRQSHSGLVPITFVLVNPAWDKVLHWGYLSVSPATAREPERLTEIALPLAREWTARGGDAGFKSVFAPGHLPEAHLVDGGYPGLLARLKRESGDTTTPDPWQGRYAQ